MSTRHEIKLPRSLQRRSRHASRRTARTSRYEGETAQKFAAEMAKNGAPDHARRFERVQSDRAETAYRGVKYKNYEIITAPPPSSGGIGMLQILGMLEGSGYEKTGFGSAASISYVAEAMASCFYADRSEYFGGIPIIFQGADHRPASIRRISKRVPLLARLASTAIMRRRAIR